MRLLLALVLTLLAALAGLGNAHAHASLRAAVPAAGAVLPAAPDQVTLTFSEPVAIARLSLLGPDGHTAPLGQAVQDGPVLRIPLPPLQAVGTYLFSWRVISADGHPIGGTVDFSLGAAAGGVTAAAAVTVAETSATLRASLIWLLRTLAYVCLLGACGAAAFRGLLRCSGSPWLWRVHGLWLLPSAGLALLAASLGLQGLDLLDAPWPALLQTATWRAALGTTYAQTLGLAALSLGLAAWALAHGRRAGPAYLGLIALLGLGAALASSGHASTAPPQWFSRPVVALHVMAAAAWIGALWPLRQALRHGAGPQPGQDLLPAQGRPTALSNGPAVLRVFSRWITPTVALLVLSGIALAALQLRQPADLWHTDYGRVLETKVVLVALLLALAAWNRWRLTRPALAGDGRAVRRLAQSIVLELLLAALILGMVSLWRFTPPPRSLPTQAPALVGIAPHPADHAPVAPAAPPAITLHDTRVRAQLQPLAQGDEWRIHLQDTTGQALPAEGIDVQLENPDAGIAAIQRQATRQADGDWTVALPTLPPVGRWTVRLRVLIDDFDQVVLEGVMEGVLDGR